MDEFKLEIGSIGNLEMLTDHRTLMWIDIHPELKMKIEKSRKITKEWIREKLLDRSLIPFIVRTSDGTIAGSGCILIKEDQPRPGSDQLKHPYLLSMYTLPEFRKKGVASMIVKAAIEWSLRNKFDRITLHASAQAFGLYKKFGFKQTNEMRLKLTENY